MPAKPDLTVPENKITVADSPIHGQGVFALVDIKKGEVIERCPYIVIDDDDLQEENRLNDYLFTSPDASTDYLVVMGYGMMYNHDDNANSEWEIDQDNRFVRFTATRDIKKGDEIFQNYGEEYWKTRE
ncbi:MAG: SET domain-containing protein [Candidatus Puniceispirillales bacterium]